MTLRILIVDNESRSRASLKALLDSWFHPEGVCEAASGSEAMRKIEELKPDLVLTDARMDLADGVELTSLIKGKYPEIPVVVLSLHSEYRVAALAAGADAFVGKGEPLDRLHKTLLEIKTKNSSEAA